MDSKPRWINVAVLAGLLALTALSVGVALLFLGTSIKPATPGTDAGGLLAAEDLRALRLSIVWQGNADRPVPEVVFVVDDRHADEDPWPFKPTVVLSPEQMRAVLDVLGPIYERRQDEPTFLGYAAVIDSGDQHIEFALGDSGAAQASVLKSIAEHVGQEGQSALALMVDHVSPPPR